MSIHWATVKIVAVHGVDPGSHSLLRTRLGSKRKISEAAVAYELQNDRLDAIAERFLRRHALPAAAGVGRPEPRSGARGRDLNVVGASAYTRLLSRWFPVSSFARYNRSGR